MTWPWPPSIDLGPVSLHAFGLLVGLGFVAAYEVLRRVVTATGRPKELATALFVAAFAGGIIGSKVNFLITNPPEGAGDVFSGTGFTWYGGLLGGTLCVAVVARAKRLPFLSAADLLSLPLLVGLAIGRFGCLVAADGDYGTPTDLPWKVAWPEGLVPTTVGAMNDYFGTDYAGASDKLLYVHPAPLYEALMLLAGAAVLWRMRHRLLHRAGLMFGWYAMVGGTARLLVEFVRFNDPVALGLTMAQWWSIALIVIGGALVAARRRPQETA
jgi:phosphatidylglycerol---prolipoprotein diacylglyceryl transferase